MRERLRKLISAFPSRMAEIPPTMRLFSAEFSRKFPGRQIDCKEAQIELISLHIPKTAGTSFGNTLKSVYGNAFTRFDMFPNKPHPQTVPHTTRVIHGHFKYPDIAALFHISDDVAVITWVRDPAERVISQYFYFQQILRESMKEEYKHMHTLQRMEKTLLEFAEAERNQNRMTKFLRGIRLQEMFFVGIQEYFSEDLADLAAMLHWQSVMEFHHNPSSTQRELVAEEIKAEILTLNSQDKELYQEALYLRKLRRERLQRGHA